MSLFNIVFDIWPEISALIFHWEVWFYVSIGTIIGLTVGSIPGMTGSMGIAITLPFTFYMSPVNAISLLIGIYKSSMFGGAISAIAFGTPGTPPAAADVPDGYSLTKKGECRKAIQIALYASTTADLLSDFVLLFVVVPLALIGLAFGSREMLALMFFVLVAIVLFGGTDEPSISSVSKSFISILFGFILSTIGRDPVSAVNRFSFGLRGLGDGIGIIPLVIGLYSFSEIYFQVVKIIQNKAKKNEENLERAKNLLGGKNLTFKEYLSCYKEILTGWLIGTFIGALPGPGSILAAFTSYAFSKRFSSNRQNFGKGALEGLAAAEAGNSATAGATFIPLFAFGIPGSLMAGLFVGAFMLQGITPGPGMFREYPEIVYTILIVLIIANIFNLIIGRILSPFFAYIASIKSNILIPCLTILATIGVYAVRHSIMDIVFLVVLGLFGYFARYYSYPLSPILIGFIIGPMIETYLRRALLIGRGEFRFLFESNIANIIYLITFFICFGYLIYALLSIRKNKSY